MNGIKKVTWLAIFLSSTSIANAQYISGDENCRKFDPWLESKGSPMSVGSRYDYASDVLTDFTLRAAHPEGRPQYLWGEARICETTLFKPNFYLSIDVDPIRSFYIDPVRLKAADKEKNSDPSFYVEMMALSWTAFYGNDVTHWLEAYYQGGLLAGEKGVSRDTLIGYINKMEAPLPQDQMHLDQARRIYEGWEDGFEKLHGYRFQEPWYTRAWNGMSDTLKVIALLAGGTAPLFGLYRFGKRKKWFRHKKLPSNP